MEVSFDSCCIIHSHYRLNPHCEVIVHDLVLESSNAQPLIDACVLGGKPLVSGSALRLDGQLTIYNYRDGPCYRCLSPTPPPSETVTNCSDGGVLGVGKTSVWSTFIRGKVLSCIYLSLIF